MRFQRLPLAILARGFALLILGALYPVLAFGLDQTYEGKLVPDSGSAPIPIVVEVKEVATFLRGSVKTSSPIMGNGAIESGGNVSGQCTVNVALSKTISLRLRGTCEQKSYSGYYTLYDSQTRSATTGSFKLAGKAPETAKVDGGHGAAGTTGGTISCAKSNTLCLSACPRDYSTGAALCANHCRAKLKTCRGPAKKPPAIAE
ncbi:MAG: hypothetical protein ABI724_02015 [Betaproteobacteria bacterium]